MSRMSEPGPMACVSVIHIWPRMHLPRRPIEFAIRRSARAIPRILTSFSVFCASHSKDSFSSEG